MAIAIERRALALLLALGLAPAGPVAACARSLISEAFIADEATLPLALKQADWVFGGTVYAVTRVPGPRPSSPAIYEVQIKVREVWKGHVPPYVRYRQEAGCEHTPFSGERYVFFGHASGIDSLDRLYSGGTAPWRSAGAVRQFLGKPHAVYSREWRVR